MFPCQTFMYLYKTMGLKLKLNLRGSGLYHAGQDGLSASFVWPSTPVSVFKQKGGIRVSPIHYTKPVMVIIVLTPQFALNE